MRKNQSGMMLLEALIAILIFSFGVLGLVGLQASAIQSSRDAQYRSQAAMLANEFIGQMWATSRIGSELQTNFQGDGNQTGPTNVLADGATYTAWANRVSLGLTPTLPGALPPVVQITPGVAGPPQTATRVSLMVRWRAPNEASTANHSYSVVFQIL